MRVSTRLFYQGQQERISKLTDDLRRINEKIASGKTINRPSDDPRGFIDVMAIKSSLSQLEQYQRNIQFGISWLNLRDSVLGQMNDLVSRAHEVAVEMSNDTQSADNRTNAAVEIGHLFDEAIVLGNTDLGGYYIFAGYRTNAAPFSKAVVGGIETAQYQGDTHDFQIQIGKDETVAISRNGQDSLMSSNLFTTLGTLKKALEDNDMDTVRQQLDSLKNVENKLDAEMADTGAKSNRLDIKTTILSDLTLNLKETLSSVQDTDLADMAIQLKQKEMAYQAALEVAASLSELSILNYMP